jgi:hypothetical protein
MQMTQPFPASDHPLTVIRYAQSIFTVSIDWRQILPERWHVPSFEHDLVREVDSDGKVWCCQLCGKSWRSKPKTRCLGIPPIANLRHIKNNQLLTLQSAASQNLKLKPNSTPTGHDASTGIFNPYSQLLFHRDSFEIAEPILPPIVNTDQAASLKTMDQFRQLDLRPAAGSIPRACYCISSYISSTMRFCLLYDVADCVEGYESAYITKTRLMKTYYLSEGWLLALGDPGLTQPNPHYESAAPMQLYLRDRVEAFLADRADEYAAWLENRNKRVEIARAISAQAKKKRILVREQTQKCLTCASSWVRDGGFWCAIHPKGWLDGVPNEFFCPDWHGRS